MAIATATGMGLVAGHELQPGRNWRDDWLGRPGKISGLSEWARRFDAWRCQGLSIVDLRNAIVAEKVARICRKLYGNSPAQVSIMFGTGHGGMKKMLENSATRQETIRKAAIDRQIIEDFSGMYDHMFFDENGQYVLRYDNNEFK